MSYNSISQVPGSRDRTMAITTFFTYFTVVSVAQIYGFTLAYGHRFYLYWICVHIGVELQDQSILLTPKITRLPNGCPSLPSFRHPYRALAGIYPPMCRDLRQFRGWTFDDQSAVNYPSILSIWPECPKECLLVALTDSTTKREMEAGVNHVRILISVLLLTLTAGIIRRQVILGLHMFALDWDERDGYGRRWGKGEKHHSAGISKLSLMVEFIHQFKLNLIRMSTSSNRPLVTGIY